MCGVLTEHISRDQFSDCTFLSPHFEEVRFAPSFFGFVIVDLHLVNNMNSNYVGVFQNTRHKEKFSCVFKNVFFLQQEICERKIWQIWSMMSHELFLQKPFP